MKRESILLLAFLVLTGCAGSKATQEPPKPAVPVTQTQPAKPAPEPPKEPAVSEGPIRLLPAPKSPLWGGPVSVVVENSPGARPQAGLQEADLVVEMLAEAEISRFLALYWSNPVAKIGPVRSARTTSMAVADAYGAPYFHSGGSAEALAILQNEWGARNVDEIYGGGAYFFRSADRDPPHNLYTSTDRLNQAVDGRKLKLKAVPTSDRDSNSPAPGQAATRVNIDWHRLHKVQWQWQGDRYLRLEDGIAHLAESGRQLWAANLVLLNIEGENRGPDFGWTLDYKSGGKATVLVAGHRWEGTWNLSEGGFVLTPAAGSKALLLAPGPTWVHLVTQESDFTIE